MRLTELDPKWTGVQGDQMQVPPRWGVGLSFNCPCGGDHRIGVEFQNPLDGGRGRPGMWIRTGSTFESLTVGPSIREAGGGGCGWHGFIRDGEVRNA